MRIQSGTTNASIADSDWELHKGHGARTHRMSISFEEPFTTPPTVVPSISGFEVAKGENVRLNVRVVSAEHDKFKLEFKTWNSTKVLQAYVSWIAYGK